MQTLIKLAPLFWLSEHILLSTQADSVALKQLKFLPYFEILAATEVLHVKHGQKVPSDAIVTIGGTRLFACARRLLFEE